MKFWRKLRLLNSGMPCWSRPCGACGGGELSGKFNEELL
jgi:hypothetical protein